MLGYHCVQDFINNAIESQLDKFYKFYLKFIDMHKITSKEIIINIFKLYKNSKNSIVPICYVGNSDILRKLLKLGLDPNTVYENGSSLIFYAAQKKDYYSFKLYFQW